MVQRYLPKIKADTAKTIAKGLIANRSGGKISNEKFKQILKKDQDLRSYYYKPKNASLTKYQTKKFIDKVVSTAKTTPSLRVSRLAQKLGIKPGAQSGTSDIFLNKVYQKATKTQLDAQKPTGPSPEEVQREKRHDQMLKTLHTRERAEEVTRENKEHPSQQQQSPSAASETAPGVQMQHSGIGTASASQPASSAIGTSAVSVRGSATARRTRTADGLKTLILPVFNASPNVQGLDMTVEKINKLLRQVLAAEPDLRILPENAFHEALYSLRLDAPPSPDDTGTIAALVRAARADIAVVGSVRRTGYVTNASIRLINTESKKSITLASVHDAGNDSFELERKIRWQVDHALSDSAGADGIAGSASAIPGADEAIDLPI